MAMVTVHRAHGFQFTIFANDHAPPHIHVFGQGGEAKIDLLPGGDVVVTWTNGIARADLRRILAEARDQHKMLSRAWERMHG